MSVFTNIVSFLNKNKLLIKCKMPLNRKERRELKFEEKRLNRLFEFFNNFDPNEYYYQRCLEGFMQNCRYVENIIKPKYFEVNRYYFKNKFKHLK